MNVKIEKIRHSSEVEDFVIFSLNGNFYEAFNHEGKLFKEGKIVKVKLSLCDFKSKIVRKARQTIQYTKSVPMSVNYYKIYGQVIEQYKGGIVVDAGNGFVFKTGSLKVKLQDYIYVEGRLDIKGDVE